VARSEAILTALLGAALLAGCSQLERLTIVRPSAHIRSTTQVAPTYDVSGRRGHKADDAYQLMASATDYFQRGEYDQSERLLQQALRIPGAAADANTLLGMIADARGRNADAGRFYEAATVAAPNSAPAANNYGKWLCANGRPADSLAWFERALGNPAYTTPIASLSNAGECAQAAGQSDRAERYWRAALGMDPRMLPALIGMARLEFARGNYLDARAFSERWLAVAPADPAGLRLAAATEQKLGDNAAASRYLSRLQALSPGAPPVPPSR